MFGNTRIFREGNFVLPYKYTENQDLWNVHDNRREHDLKLNHDPYLVQQIFHQL
jgi:hypothetical protein